ncbi:hypothetical protein DRP77_11470, partial [Candidatus Poribacteria bacterium]
GYERFKGTGARWMWTNWSQFAHHNAYFRLRFNLKSLMSELRRRAEDERESEKPVLEHIAFEAGRPIDIRLRYPPGRELTLELKGAAYRLRWDGQRYALDLPPMDPGVYTIEILEGGERILKERIIVWRRRGKAEGEPVRIVNGRFVDRDGKPFILLGFAVNHVYHPGFDPPKLRGGWIESAWPNAGERELADWLGFLAMNGINAIRVGLTVYWDGIPGDRGGRADPKIIEALDRLLQVADSMGMKVIPVFYWGPYGTYGFQNEAYDRIFKGKPGREWFSNPEALKLQKGFIGEVVGRFKDDPRVLAWELMNEIRPSMDPVYVRWVDELAEFIRGLGVRNLVKIDFLPRNGADMAVLYGNKSRVDLYGYRGYPIGRSSADLGSYLSAYARYAALTRAVGLVGEFGAKEGEKRRIVTRDAIWLSLLAGAPGVIGWDAGMCDPREFKIAAEVFERIDLEAFKRARAPVAIEVDGDGRDLYEAMRYDLFFQFKGIDYDLILPGSDRKGYAAVLRTKWYDISNWWRLFELKPPRIDIEPIVEVSNGYAASYMMGEGGDPLIIYARNIRDIDRDGVRIRGRTPFRARVRLEGRHVARCYDLDERSVVYEGKFEDELIFELGLTEHDFLLLIEKPN